MERGSETWFKRTTSTLDTPEVTTLEEGDIITDANGWDYEVVDMRDSLSKRQIGINIDRINRIPRRLFQL